jgi:TetR/AcrR family transcriptional regulator, transcriptional repressor for nem operon
MARPQAYDTQQALQQASELFWAQGYSATSIDQLLEVMGLSRSSLYHAFGDKRSLFLQVLEFFASQMDPVCEMLTVADNPAQVVRTFFEQTHLNVADPNRHKGCLLVNTVVELADVDVELVATAATHLKRLEQALCTCFERGVASGQLAADKDPQALAQFFMSVNKGLRVSMRHGASNDEIRAVAETALLVLA